MNKNISIFKKMKLFKEYKSILKPLKNELMQTFGAKVDNAHRIYTVINIPIDGVGEPYNLRKTDIDKIAETYIKDYTTEIVKFLNNKGLSSELFDFYEVTKVDKYSYLIVFGFSLFKSNEYYDNIRFKLIPAVIGVSILLTILFLIV